MGFVVVTSMIMKFVTGTKLGVFYTIVAKKVCDVGTIRKYDAITCILADAIGLNFWCFMSILVCLFQISSQILLLKTFKILL